METKRKQYGKTNFGIPDPSHDIWKSGARALESIFCPKSVALIGATEKENSVGRALLTNLTSASFKGKIYPVNPKRDSVLGFKAYPNVSSLPEKPELVVIVTPAAAVPGIISECVSVGVKAAVIISAGFKELGNEGAELERQILQIAKPAGMRIIGPNCLGVMNPVAGLNATFASQIARKGHVAFISQSGALCTAVLDWSSREHVGFSSFISVGSMMDVGWGDLIDYLGDDPNTESILIYMESVGDARAFLSAAREVALTKPIIILKVGRTAGAMKAAVSHTGSIAGSDAVLDAAFRRCGILRVTEVRELFYMAEILAKQPRPKSPKLAVLTNAGGPGVLAADALSDAGGELAPLSENSLRSLNEFLPAHWSHNNPVDILGDAGPLEYQKALEVLVKDPSNNGLLVVLTPQAMSDAAGTAEKLAAFAKSSPKPILASWMGADAVENGRNILRRAGIPVFPYPDEAARLFCSMWRYNDNLKSLYETPLSSKPVLRENDDPRKAADEIILKARLSKRTILTEYESKKILAAYGIPVVETLVAVNEADAIALAEKIKYPVVLKLHSETITHKTDVDAVKLNLENAHAVKEAFGQIKISVESKKGSGSFSGVTVQPMIRKEGYELIIGSSIDAQFGPVILFGSGGQAVEVFKDTALGLPPLNTTLSQRLIERTRIFEVFKGIRGRKPIDLSKLNEVLVRFSQLVATERRIKEIDINPFFVSPGFFSALDARVILHGPEISEDSLPKCAIRPYPEEYVTSFTLKSGTDLTIRPIRPEDEPLMVDFHRTLSEQSVLRRYFTSIGLDERVAHERLTKVCFNDYDRQIALVADQHDPSHETHRILAVARLSRLAATGEAEFSMIVSDLYQNQGLGHRLLELILEVARKEKIKKITAKILPDNQAMRKLCGRFGFTTDPEPSEGLIKFYLIV